MKTIMLLTGLATLLLTAGCATDDEHHHQGGNYSGYGEEYPYQGYGEYRYHPYDRDHYWDRYHY